MALLYGSDSSRIKFEMFGLYFSTKETIFPVYSSTPFLLVEIWDKSSRLILSPLFPCFAVDWSPINFSLFSGFLWNFEIFSLWTLSIGNEPFRYDLVSLIEASLRSSFETSLSLWSNYLWFIRHSFYLLRDLVSSKSEYFLTIYKPLIAFFVNIFSFITFRSASFYTVVSLKLIYLAIFSSCLIIPYFSIISAILSLSVCCKFNRFDYWWAIFSYSWWIV